MRFRPDNSGATIKLQEYIDTCKRLMAEDPTLTEIFALDVIGDWRASLKNVEEMWRQGIEAILAFHPGEPEAALKGIAKDYPKIALGGVVGWVKKKKRNSSPSALLASGPPRFTGLECPAKI